MRLAPRWPSAAPSSLAPTAAAAALLLLLLSPAPSSSFRLAPSPLLLPPASVGRRRTAPPPPPVSRRMPDAPPPGLRRSYGSVPPPTGRGVCAALHSLRRLVYDIAESASSRSRSPPSSVPPRTVFVGGKGGVGKTTVSSSLAVSLSSDPELDLSVLIVSTDPAHSLGDALDVDLRSSRGEPVLMTDPLTGGRLSACEVDPAAALDGFRDSVASFDVDRLADALGVSPQLLEGFGLREFAGLLNNPPPGLDELVALSNVLDLRGRDRGKYDAVIVDTAPTGHTLRMLALPEFLDTFLGKLIALRAKLSGLASTLRAMLGSERAAQRAKTIDDAVGRLEEFKARISALRERLRDSERTSFMVVTIPTKLGVAESKRLMAELAGQGVAVTDVVVNQCVGGLRDGDDDDDDDGDGEASETASKYYERRRAGQRRWIEKLREAVDGVSASEEYRNNGPESGPIALTEVPFFDVELVGVPALAYVGKQTFEGNPSFEHLLGDDGGDDSGGPRFVICGGKGGVGKTTTSSSLAVSMAARGHSVAIVSTDPAHSLGDALDMSLRGGQLVDVPLIGVPPSDGTLRAMEVDPAMALSQFKGLVDDLVGGDGGPPSDLANTLRDLGEIFDTLPAGTDEVVALAKVVNLIKGGEYDRVVLDTAPTGHTLRMLGTPTFLADLIERVLQISARINSNAAVRMIIGGAASRAGRTADDVDAAAEAAKSALLRFQFQMYDLEDLFCDAERTEFLIVAVPTELAVRESVRLLNDLTFEAPDMPVKVRNVVANQVLSEGEGGDDAGAFLRRVGEGEASSIRELREVAAAAGSVAGGRGGPSRPAEVTEVPYIDTEPRGVFGLRALAEELLRE